MGCTVEPSCTCDKHASQEFLRVARSSPARSLELDCAAEGPKPSRPEPELLDEDADLPRGPASFALQRLTGQIRARSGLVSPVSLMRSTRPETRKKGKQKPKSLKPKVPPTPRSAPRDSPRAADAAWRKWSKGSKRSSRPRGLFEFWPGLFGDLGGGELGHCQDCENGGLR